MADLPKHPSRVDEPRLPPLPRSPFTYAKGRNIALAVYIPASVLTAPILLLFSAYATADSLSVEGEGVFLLVCALVIAAVVHGGVTVGLLTSVANVRGRGNPVGADGLLHGWIYGAAANILFFLACVLVFRVIAT